ncbi:DUF6178 family protein [Geomonas sp.]|uniref:DUF6178 family protein n=1 Tax=Geomonas sp. TaxID=2651584 RepID=UPI002B48B6B1|nr:DUF6178 family protein [Geomonas sp.]HJV35970.1 DUF6178 family protein [Geomonas sp.]
MKQDTLQKSAEAFHSLPLAEKRSYLRQRGAKEKLNLIISDSEGKRLTASLEPQEFFWLMKEVGENDAVELLQLASAEQCVFILDMELWEGWTFSQERACHWLAHFMEGGEPRIHELLKHLDFEFLQLFLSRELVVGGGIGDQSNDEERLADYDHTFDGVFMLTFKNPKHSQLIGSFVSMLIKLDNELYTALMEGIKGDVDVEMEEQCLRFRSGRLEDLGFPPLEEAVSIYARVNPDNFEVHGDKQLAPAGEGGQLVPILPREETLLFRALALADSPTLLQELNYLVNSALVAEGTAVKEPESMVGILDRVCGYLNIALESLTGGDEGRAAILLTGEPLKRLFQLGFSIVLELQFTAREIESADYASGKLISGLKAKRPRYYRGLDSDGVDGYREFKDLADVERTAEMLKHLHS